VVVGPVWCSALLRAGLRRKEELFNAFNGTDKSVPWYEATTPL
jgi:hypothetical protein